MLTPHQCGIAAKIGSYSDAIEAAPGARQLVSSGTPGLMPDGKLPPDFKTQAQWAWRNVMTILAAAGMGREDIVKVTQYLTRREDLADYRPIRSEFLGDARPASMLLFVDGLVWPDMLIEIEVLAAKGGT